SEDSGGLRPRVRMDFGTTRGRPPGRV
ncbi:hypothetical protein BN1708_020110, partial [Verticillium longisporum]